MQKNYSKYLLLFILLITNIVYAKSGEYILEFSPQTLEGSFSNTAIDNFSYLVQGPEIEKIYTGSEMFLSSFEKISDGSYIFGTSSPANIYLLSLQNRPKVIKLTNFPDTAMVSYIQKLEKDTFLIATSIPAKVYLAKLENNNISLKELINIGEQSYIWGIVDNRYLFTGNPANIWEISFSTQSIKTQSLIFQNPSVQHFIYPRKVREKIFFATSGKSILYVLEGGKVWTAGTIKGKEITDYTFDNENLLIVSLLEEQRIEVQEKQQAPKGPPVLTTSQLFFLPPYGTPQPLPLPQKPYTSITTLKDFYVLGAMDGSVILLEKNFKNFFITDTGLSIFSIKNIDENVFIFTSSPAGIYLLRYPPQNPSIYISKVIDIGSVVRWGNIILDYTTKGGKVKIFTRTGNTPTPDDNTWSEWKELPPNKKIQSPCAQYIQCKIILEEGTKLKSLRITFSKNNNPPIIYNIKIKEGNTKEKETEKEGRKDDISISWEAKDPDGDNLVFYVYVKEKTDSYWLPLTTTPIKEATYKIPYRLLPDGEYVVKVVASDEMSNTPQETLSNFFISDVFVVDNTPPTISDISFKNSILTFSVSDSSGLKNVSISTNFQDWITVEPEDGIFDEEKEKFTIGLNLPKGENIIVIKAVDRYNNIRIARKRVVKE